MWFEVMVEGSPRHPALAGGDRSNAIENAFLLCKALRDLEAQWNEERSNHPLFADLEHPIVINVGKIEGGDWTSSVPSWCRFEIRVGIYPGWKREWVISEIERCLLEAAAHDPFLARFPPRVRPKGQYGEGYVVENADQAVEILARHHRQVFDRDLMGRVGTGSSDARILGLDGGIPSLLYGPIGRNHHSYDEAVDLDSVRRVTQTLALFTASWCGFLDT